MVRRLLAALAAFVAIFTFSPAASAQCVSGITNADVFGFAQATFPGLFPGAPTSGRISNWDYRYYAGSNTYIGVQDSTCAIGVLGPVTGGTLVSSWTVNTFSSLILAWKTPSACTYAPTTTSVNAAATGETVTFDVRQQQTACTVPNPPWTVSSSCSWVTNARAGSLSNGQGPAYFDVAANTGTAARSCSVTVAGNAVTITQAAGSSFSLAGTYNGRWSGSCGYYGSVSGTFNMTVSGSGTVGGSYAGADSGNFTGSVSATGTLAANGSGSVSGGATWSGTIRAGGTGSIGSWSDAQGCSGSWSVP